jgi:hypothetical protein
MGIPFILYGVKGIFLYNSNVGNTLYIKPQTGKRSYKRDLPFKELSMQ